MENVVESMIEIIEDLLQQQNELLAVIRDELEKILINVER